VCVCVCVCVYLCCLQRVVQCVHVCPAGLRVRAHTFTQWVSECVCVFVC